MGLAALDQQVVVLVSNHHVKQALPVGWPAGKHHITCGEVTADKDFCNVKSEFQWQAHRLTTACGKYLGSLLHFEPPHGLIYTMVCTSHVIVNT